MEARTADSFELSKRKDQHFVPLAHHLERHQHIDDDDDGRNHGHSERHENHLFSLLRPRLGGLDIHLTGLGVNQYYVIFPKLSIEFREDVRDIRVGKKRVGRANRVGFRR